MAAPRFLLVGRAAYDGPDVAPWPGGWAPPADLPTSAGPWIAWRLVGANNRELGRSARLHPDVDTCRDDIETLQRDLDKIDAVIATGAHTGRWSWRVRLHGIEVAVSGRWYRRQRECAYNLAQFLTFAPVAECVDGVGLRPRTRQIHRPDFHIDRHVSHLDEEAAARELHEPMIVAAEGLTPSRIRAAATGSDSGWWNG